MITNSVVLDILELSPHGVSESYLCSPYPKTVAKAWKKERLEETVTLGYPCSLVRPCSCLTCRFKLHTQSWGQMFRGQRMERRRSVSPLFLSLLLRTVTTHLGEVEDSIVLGGSHACLLLPDGRVKCWGGNQHGQLGLGDTRDRGAVGDAVDLLSRELPTVDLGPDARVARLCAGTAHTCAAFSSGEIKCWGNNDHGQLGYDDVRARGSGSDEMGTCLPPIGLGRSDATSVACGAFFTCAHFLHNGYGSVRCWGQNRHGQLGLGLGTGATIGDNPGEMGSLSDIYFGLDAPMAVFAGDCHACSLHASGRTKCWGCNGGGQLGLGDTEERGQERGSMGDNLPYVFVDIHSAIVHMALGHAESCALFDDGSLNCWGLLECSPLALTSVSSTMLQIGLGNPQQCIISFGKLTVPSAIASPRIPLGRALAGAATRSTSSSSSQSSSSADTSTRSTSSSSLQSSSSA
eukprot:874-Amphidinium_carterae.1